MRSFYGLVMLSYALAAEPSRLGVSHYFVDTPSGVAATAVRHGGFRLFRGGVLYSGDRAKANEDASKRGGERVLLRELGKESCRNANTTLGVLTPDAVTSGSNVDAEGAVDTGSRVDAGRAGGCSESDRRAVAGWGAVKLRVLRVLWLLLVILML